MVGIIWVCVVGVLAGVGDVVVLLVAALGSASTSAPLSGQWVVWSLQSIGGIVSVAACVVFVGCRPGPVDVRWCLAVRVVGAVGAFMRSRCTARVFKVAYYFVGEKMCVGCLRGWLSWVLDWWFGWGHLGVWLLDCRRMACDGNKIQEIQ